MVTSESPCIIDYFSSIFFCDAWSSVKILSIFDSWQILLRRWRLMKSEEGKLDLIVWMEEEVRYKRVWVSKLEVFHPEGFVQYNGAKVSQRVKTFYVLLTVHHVMILGKWPTWCTNYFYVFNSIYNFLHVSSTSCSSSGETNCINTASHIFRTIVTSGCIDTLCLSLWWARCARNM